MIWESNIERLEPPFRNGHKTVMDGLKSGRKRNKGKRMGRRSKEMLVFKAQTHHN